MTSMPIVDDNDVIICHKDRDDLEYDRDIYRSSAVWVYNSKGQVLIAQRKLTKKRQPGKWGPSVAGTVEGDETYEENAYKEVQEELGINAFKLIRLRKVRTDDEVHQFTEWYSAKIDEPLEYFTPQPEEVEAIEWIDKEHLVDNFLSNKEKYVKSMKVCLDMLEEIV